MDKEIQKFLINFIPSKKKRHELREQLMSKNMRRQLKPFRCNDLINPEDKILIVAPHPDDEVISCGGIIAKYAPDVLCVNSSGVKYDWNKETEEEIAQIRCDEFYNVMKQAGVKKSYIAKIWGIPPMFEQINAHFSDYLQNFHFKDYDIIFCPHKLDGHREHRFVGNHLLKKLLNKQGYKKTLKIARYEVWGTIAEPNYFEDITDFVTRKKELINAYVSRIKGNYADRMLALNHYRAITAFNSNPNSYAEAFLVQNVKEYLKEKDDRSWKVPW